MYVDVTHLKVSNKISLKCVLLGQIDNKSALVQVMALFMTSNKPLFAPMLTMGDTILCLEATVS